MKTKDLFHRLPAKARILLIRLRSMGDCLLLTSPVRALKEEFPGFRISVLVEDRFAPCFDGNPDFNEIIRASDKTDTAFRLAARRFHAIINLHGGPTSFTYACAAIGPRIGSAQYQYAKLYNGVVPAPDPGAHTTESTLATFRWLGVKCETPPALRFEPHPVEAEQIKQTLRDRPYAVIHPAALMATKRWDPSRFAAVAEKLQKLGLTIVLTCGPGEESIVGQVAKGVSQSIMFLGLKIQELAELIRGARIYVGNDTGPMHLAAAVGTPTVAIWGSSDSRRWKPWGVQSRVVQNPFECNPCAGYRCSVADSPLCIESVTVEQVDQAIGELFGSVETPVSVVEPVIPVEAPQEEVIPLPTEPVEIAPEVLLTVAPETPAEVENQPVAEAPEVIPAGTKKGAAKRARAEKKPNADKKPRRRNPQRIPE